MQTPKQKHHPFCFSVKGYVKMLRLVRPGHRVGAVLTRAQGQREMALKYKEESPALSFNLGLPGGKAVQFTVHPAGRRRERRHSPALQGFTDTQSKVSTSGHEWPPLGPAHQLPRLLGQAAALAARFGASGLASTLNSVLNRGLERMSHDLEEGALAG